MAAGGLVLALMGSSWLLLGPRPLTPAVSAFAVFYDNGASFADWQAHSRNLSFVFLDAATIRPDGTVAVMLPAPALRLIRSRHLFAYLVVSNDAGAHFDGQELASILASPSRTARLLGRLVRLAADGPFVGLNIDFEQNPTSDAARFTAFLAALHLRLTAVGKQLSVDVPAKTEADTWDGGYNLRAIGRVVDQVVVMAYDDHYPGGPAGAISPWPWVRQSLIYTLTRIPADKVLLGLAAYAYDWHGDSTDTLTLSQAVAAADQAGIRPSWDPVAQSPHFSYSHAGQLHQVFFENVRSLSALLKLAHSFQLAGVAVWRLGLEPPNFWPPLNSFRLTSGG
ncbi:MAG: glycosyl hydrolase family 18 protein [Sulfobacillus sp.]